MLLLSYVGCRDTVLLLVGYSGATGLLLKGYCRGTMIYWRASVQGYRGATVGILQGYCDTAELLPKRQYRTTMASSLSLIHI